MPDFIRDEKNGRCIARIVDGEIFRETDGSKFATLRAGNVYDLTGALIGHLENAQVTGLRTSETPVSFKKALEGIRQQPVV